MKMQNIEVLDSLVLSQVRSEIATPSFSQCVQELIMNSIDANASDIVCEFDTKNLCCKVNDDGHGFSDENLSRVGKCSFSNRLIFLNYSDNTMETSRLLLDY